MTDIDIDASEMDKARDVLVAHGCTPGAALYCLEVLTTAGFLVTRPQVLLDAVAQRVFADFARTNETQERP